jgi:hypothetical protein
VITAPLKITEKIEKFASDLFNLTIEIIRIVIPTISGITHIQSKILNLLFLFISITYFN